MERPSSAEWRRPEGGLGQQFMLPEWEVPAQSKGKKPPYASWSMTSHARQALVMLNRAIPNDRKYLGMRRRNMMWVVMVTSVLILALIVSLSVGLTGRSRGSYQGLPLGSKTYTGDLTYYGPGLDACGSTSSDDDDIVSISHFTFDAVSKGSNPNANPLCHHKIRAMREGHSVDLTVVDRCVGCKPSDIDVSPGAFKRLADPALGKVSVSWVWLPPVPST